MPGSGIVWNRWFFERQLYQDTTLHQSELNTSAHHEKGIITLCVVFCGSFHSYPPHPRSGHSSTEQQWVSLWLPASCLCPYTFSSFFQQAQRPETLLLPLVGLRKCTKVTLTYCSLSSCLFAKSPSTLGPTLQPQELLKLLMHMAAEAPKDLRQRHLPALCLISTIHDTCRTPWL